MRQCVTSLFVFPWQLNVSHKAKKENCIQTKCLKLTNSVTRILLTLNPKGFTDIAVLHEHIHSTRVITVSAKELFLCLKYRKLP